MLQTRADEVIMAAFADEVGKLNAVRAALKAGILRQRPANRDFTIRCKEGACPQGAAKKMIADGGRKKASGRGGRPSWQKSPISYILRLSVPGLSDSLLMHPNCCAKCGASFAAKPSEHRAKYAAYR